MEITFRDKCSEGDGVLMREFQIPVTFSIPKLFVDQLTDISPEVLKGLIADVQKKLDLESLCISVLTMLSWNFRSQGEKREAKKVDEKLEKLYGQVIALVEYGLQESSRIMSKDSKSSQ